MFINASQDSRSLDMVDLRYVFKLLSVLNERSHSANIIGNVHKMWIKVWMLGKNSRSHVASSRRSVSQGAVQKTACEKIKKRSERKRENACGKT